MIIGHEKNVKNRCNITDQSDHAHWCGSSDILSVFSHYKLQDQVR